MKGGLHDWRRLDTAQPVTGGIATHVCNDCASTLPHGSAIFPCPGPGSETPQDDKLHGAANGGGPALHAT